MKKSEGKSPGCPRTFLKSQSISMFREEKEKNRMEHFILIITEAMSKPCIHKRLRSMKQETKENDLLEWQGEGERLYIYFYMYYHLTASFQQIKEISGKDA